jgi:putative oxidoreductase
MRSEGLAHSIGLLILRLTGLVMLRAHGLDKLRAFPAAAAEFADPIGLGPSLSMALVTFAEAFCAAAVAIGLLTRWAAVPLVINMSVIVFIAHGADPFGKKLLPILYLLVYSGLLFLGAGRLSVDHFLKQRLPERFARYL